MLRAVQRGDRAAAADRHSRAVAGGAGRRGRRHPADPGVPLPADGSHRRRGAHRQSGRREEGTVPLARGDEEHPRQGRGGREREGVHHGARQLVRLSEPGRRHARVPDRPRASARRWSTTSRTRCRSRAAKESRPAARRSSRVRSPAPPRPPARTASSWKCTTTRRPRSPTAPRRSVPTPRARSSRMC